MIRIVVIGYGAIGSDLVQRLLTKYGPELSLGVLLDKNSQTIEKLPKQVVHLADIKSVKEYQPDLVIEAAGHQAVRAYAKDCLEAGISFLIVSVGVLADDKLFSDLKNSASKNNSKLILPSGAIGGMDYLRAASQVPNATVVYESRKPPKAWENELLGLGIRSPITEQIVIFEGDARTAATKYPQNLNVAAVMSLAGIGFEKTQVRIVIDPDAKGNTHQIFLKGDFGEVKLNIQNRPSPDNPKTSWIVSLSIFVAIEQYLSPVIFM